MSIGAEISGDATAVKVVVIGVLWIQVVVKCVDARVT